MNRLYVGAAAGLLLLFLACEMTGPESGTSAGLDGKAAVHIIIEAEGIQGQAANSRTVLPVVGLANVGAWELWGGKSSDAALLGESSSDTFPTIYLETGTWDFILKGYTEKGGALILQGDILSRNISLDETNVLPFTVAPIWEGNGTLKITINLPAGHGITEAKVFNTEGELEVITPNVDNAVVFEHEYPSGDYYFSIQLYKDAARYGVVSEVVQVRGNLGSEKTYTLTWEDLNLTYTLTYELNGGELDASVENPGYYRSTNKNITLPTPTLTGHSFGGWYDNEGLDGSAVTVIPQGSTGDKTFYAKWTAVYTVTFDAEGGSPGTETRTVNDQETVGSNMPSEPSRSYAAFGGWYTEQNGGGDEFTGTTPVTGDITVYAKWTAVVYTVTFDIGDESPEERRVNGGETVGSDMPSAPTQSGYTFGGWYTAQNGGGDEFTGTTPVTGDIWVYAKWTAVYTVTFNAEGVSPSTQTREVEIDGTLGSNMPSEPSRSGYTFDGWYTGQNGSGNVFTGSTQVNGDITVYAKWSCTVTFDPDGGSSDTETRTVNGGETVGSNMPSAPSRDGYTFGGWYTGRNGGGDAFTGSTTVNVNITVYAKWSCTVTFDADGGSPTGRTRTVESDGTIGYSNMPTEPSRSGYTFDGWYTEQNGGGDAFTDATQVTGNITVYAKWLCTVTFNADGGTPITQTRTAGIGGTVGVMPSEPTRSGNAFGGWYTGTSGGGSQFTESTTVSGNITVYARWNPRSSVEKTLRPQPDDAVLSNMSLFVDEDAVFSAAGSGYVSWQWYWQGKQIGGADLETYTLEANSQRPGVYEAAVVATTSGGVKLSARCRVTIKAR
jgi:uncharacterized repeat protein (TIGR02543 family)